MVLPSESFLPFLLPCGLNIVLLCVPVCLLLKHEHTEKQIPMGQPSEQRVRKHSQRGRPQNKAGPSMSYLAEVDMGYSNAHPWK